MTEEYTAQNTKSKPDNIYLMALFNSFYKFNGTLYLKLRYEYIINLRGQ